MALLEKSHSVEGENNSFLVVLKALVWGTGSFRYGCDSVIFMGRGLELFCFTFLFPFFSHFFLFPPCWRTRHLSHCLAIVMM